MSRILNNLIICLILLISGCATYLDAPKYQFSDGYYKVKLTGSMPTRVYVENEGDSIVIYLLRKKGKSYEINTSRKRKIVFKQIREDSLFRKSSFSHQSFDFDFLTIPLRYRFSQDDFPRQLNYNLSGVIYLGLRKDVYNVNYERLITENFKRNISHVGYSFGGFSGIGSTVMNPSVTNNNISIEYDGIVWLKGIAWMTAINKYTVGASLGWDTLLDQNNKYWIYQGKPWIGLALGINLN